MAKIPTLAVEHLLLKLSIIFETVFFIGMLELKRVIYHVQFSIFFKGGFGGSNIYFYQYLQPHLQKCS